MRTPDLLTGHARATARALAEAVMPEGKVFPGGSDRDVTNLEQVLRGLGTAAGIGYTALLYALDAESVVRHRKPFASITPEQRITILERWRGSGTAGHGAALALTLALKVTHFDDPKVY